MYISPRPELVGVENVTSHRQPRFYGPFLGIVLANLFLNSAIANLAPLGSLRVSYDATPWIAYNKPDSHSQNYNYHGPLWKPITPSSDTVDEYGPPDLSTSTDTQHIYHHHVIDSVSGQQIIQINHEKTPAEIHTDTNKSLDSFPNYEHLIPAESNDGSHKNTRIGDKEFLNNAGNQAETTLSNYNDLFFSESKVSNVTEAAGNQNKKLSKGIKLGGSSGISLRNYNLIPSGSSNRRNAYRLRGVNSVNPQRYTIPNRRYKYQYNQNRRRLSTTTTDRSNYFYDIYDYDYSDSNYDNNNYDDRDYVTRRPNSKRKTIQRRPIDFSDDTTDNSSEYYENEKNDYTTKQYKRNNTQKKRKKPNKNKSNSKRKPEEQRQEQRSSEENEFEEDTEPVTPVLRQRQSTSTSFTTTSSPTTTITTTEITNGSTPSAPNNTSGNSTTGYGYGPSNGNEGISITYGPPQSGVGGSYLPSIPHQAYGPPQTTYGLPSAIGQYSLPLSDWYSSPEAFRNEGIGKLQDLSGFGGSFQRSKVFK